MPRTYNTSASSTPSEHVDCPDCDGAGGFDHCDADGGYYGEECRTCGGSGSVHEDDVPETCEHGIEMDDECDACAEEYRAQEEIDDA